MAVDSILPFRIRHATSVPLGKGTKFALHHGKMSTTKRRAIHILHIRMFQFTFICDYNYFISKYTDINSLHVTQIDLLHNDTFCSTLFACFRCKKRIFACDDFSGFVDTCETGKHNRVGALVLGNRSIVTPFWLIEWIVYITKFLFFCWISWCSVSL